MAVQVGAFGTFPHGKPSGRPPRRAWERTVVLDVGDTVGAKNVDGRAFFRALAQSGEREVGFQVGTPKAVNLRMGYYRWRVQIDADPAAIPRPIPPKIAPVEFVKAGAVVPDSRPVLRPLNIIRVWRGEFYLAERDKVIKIIDPRPETSLPVQTVYFNLR